MSGCAVIGPFHRRHTDAAAELITAEWPHRAHEADLFRRGEYDAVGWRWAAADPSGGGLVAYASLWRVRDDRFRMDLVVAPEWRRQGIGGRMMEMVVAAAEAEGAATLQARAYASAPDALRFLERRGFTETMRMWGLRLRLVATEFREKPRQSLENPHGTRAAAGCFSTAQCSGMDS